MKAFYSALLSGLLALGAAPALAEEFGPALPSDTVLMDEEFASASLETGEELDGLRGTEGMSATTLASITSSSMNNEFNVNMSGVNNETLDSFNNFTGIANNIQVSGAGAQVNTNTTVNVYMVTGGN